MGKEYSFETLQTNFHRNSLQLILFRNHISVQDYLITPNFLSSVENISKVVRNISCSFLKEAST